MEDTIKFAKKMTHTCRRCGRSCFNTSCGTKAPRLQCEKGHTIIDGNEKTNCTDWRPEEAVYLHDTNQLDYERKQVLVRIMNARVYRGEF